MDHPLQSCHLLRREVGQKCVFEIISFNVFPSSLQDIYGSEQVYNALLLKLYKKGKTNSSEHAKYDFG